MVKNTDDRVRLRPERIKYWMSVGALPSEKVQVLLKKYMAKIEAGAVAPTPAPAPASEAPSAG